MENPSIGTMFRYMKVDGQVKDSRSRNDVKFRQKEISVKYVTSQKRCKMHVSVDKVTKINKAICTIK